MHGYVVPYAVYTYLVMTQYTQLNKPAMANHWLI